MIGQVQTKQLLQQLIKDNKLPHFIILVGDKGSGRKTLLEELNLGDYVAPDVKVDTIRRMINDVYTLKGYTFVIPDADNMSLQAKNSLLKVVEECPNNNYFIMTLEDENNTLPTIRSRAVIYRMETYTTDEIEEYTRNYIPIPPTNEEEFIPLFVELCDTPGEVQLLSGMGAEDFYKYVEKVVDNIAKVSGSNSFKISEKIALKDGDNGYDLKLFWKAFSRVCVSRFHKAPKDIVLKYAKGVQITSESIRDLRVSGINKQALFDVWLLGIRESWI